MISKWPIYKDKMLILGNPKSQVSVCALWTKKELVAEKLNMDKIAVIGNLYSPQKGISFLIRNILANPNIRNLIICGLDNSGSGQALVDFQKYGFEKRENKNTGLLYWSAKSKIENRIDFEISQDGLDLFRQKVKIIDARNEKDFASIRNIIDNINQDQPSFSNSPIYFPEHKKGEISVFPSEPTSHVIRGGKIAKVWVQILDEILKFGLSDNTSYQNRQKEIIDLISIITDENPQDLYLPEWLPQNKHHLDKYIPTILTGILPEGASYTYGSRMRSYFGVDQVQGVINEILKEKYTRRAVISLLDPKNDCNSKNPPCLNHCWFRVQDNKLYLVATLRSNDMFEAWPENAFGLRMLQNLVFKNIITKHPEIKLGDLVIHSLSAHIYDDSWEDAKNIVEKYFLNIAKNLKDNFDLRGNFEIKVEGDEIIVEHYSLDAILLKTYKNKKAMPIYLELSKNQAIALISHALYIGTELQKAEMAIKLNLNYEQDKELITK
jgi:thymidylate synthase